MALFYFSEKFVTRLSSQIAENLPKYADKDFPEIVREEAQNSNFVGIKKSDLPMNMPNLSNNESDRINVRKVYTQLKGLTNTQATDERLWTYLTHIEAWNYMLSRWGLSSTNAKNKKKFVLERYFLRKNNSRNLVRNGISRLWWFGRLTYNDTDQWYLTDTLLSMQDIQAALLERSYGKNPIILHSALRVIAEYKSSLEERFKEQYGTKKKGYQQLGIFIGLMGGTKLLDSLSATKIEKSIKKHFLN